MSKQNIKTNTYLAAGVYKIDYKAAGYPDLMRIATEWAKDLHFKEILVRFVSQNNFGIQFIYISDGQNGNTIEKYQKDLFNKFGNSLYAWDVTEKHSDNPEVPAYKDDLVVFRSIEE